MNADVLSQPVLRGILATLDACTFQGFHISIAINAARTSIFSQLELTKRAGVHAMHALEQGAMVAPDITV